MFTRTLSLIGRENLEKLEKAHILVVGIGGVGGFALETLIRSGIGEITFIDGAKITESNLNRQVIAASLNINEFKTEQFQKRAQEINPLVKIHPLNKILTSKDVLKMDLNSYDYIIDAVDDIEVKIALIKKAQENNIPIISSMGMGNRIDPTQIEVSDIFKTFNDPLAKKVRSLLKKDGIKKQKVVFSKELPIIKTTPPASMMMVPASAGIVLASEVINSLITIKLDE